jgi:radical SAM/Cys-rich protein
VSVPTARRLLPSLKRRESPLASGLEQRALLRSLKLRREFELELELAAHTPLQSIAITVLQVNLGKRCNQTCRHCHVDAGPDRREVMTDAVLEASLALFENSAIATLDITGGAPELHPRFCELVDRASALGRNVMVRCNLTATRLPNYAHIPAHLAARRATVVASMPWFKERETDAQRGAGVFEQSIAALLDLNQRGYGSAGSGLELDLVANPVGAFLPPNQLALERDYRRELLRRYGIVFNHLYTITNMPIGRYLEYLEETGQMAAYLAKLSAAFNPRAVAGLMCRSTLSVGWDGRLYDCDFNQMLEMALPEDIFSADLASLQRRSIRTDRHCFGCTAGNGSSCGGATA